MGEFFNKLLGGAEKDAREFYGALTADRKAVKGILIATSGFTGQARDFAASLPIELIDGRQLQKLLGSGRTQIIDTGPSL